MARSKKQPNRIDRLLDDLVVPQENAGFFLSAAPAAQH
jgi:hypothetical protein